MKTTPESNTPETDSALLAGYHIYAPASAPLVKASLARKLERERDEARLLCQWAFPRLRGMCHDFDAGYTGLACAEKMESHPEIFPEYK